MQKNYGLREGISERDHGEKTKMVTIKEIAQRCGVSIATVSNILNGKPNASEATRQKVLKAVKELNYTPNSIAKNLKLKKSQTIGVVVEDITVFCALGIIDGITKCCEEKGYHILLTNLRLFKKYQDAYYTDNSYLMSVEKEIRELISKQVDGIVYVATHERILGKCLPEHLPVPASMAYGYSKSEEYPSVAVDDKNGAYKLVSYLTGMGHRSIGVITGKDESIHTRDRLRGYQKALYDQNICYNPDIVIQGDWKRECGYRYTDVLLEKGVTAIFCMNDIMAGGVYDRLEEKGLMPGRDISVVGFDNRDLSNFYRPPLTTIALPLENIGYTACEVVIDMIEKKKEEREGAAPAPGGLREIHEDCTLLVRNSVKDLNGRMNGKVTELGKMKK